jgi:hypothetical protein
MRVLVCGGRDYTDREVVYACLAEAQFGLGMTVVIHGGATGADALAKEWCLENGFPQEEYLPHYGCWGKRAPLVRNQDMIDAKPDLVLAFPGGSGTAHMVLIATRAGVEVERCG